MNLMCRFLSYKVRFRNGGQSVAEFPHPPWVELVNLPPVDRSGIAEEPPRRLARNKRSLGFDTLLGPLVADSHRRTLELRGFEPGESARNDD